MLGAHQARRTERYLRKNSAIPCCNDPKNLPRRGKRPAEITPRTEVRCELALSVSRLESCLACLQCSG
jgi:hypothetical protein